MKKWIMVTLISTVSLLLLFIILNPGMKQFEEFTGMTEERRVYIRRTANYLIYSIYERRFYDNPVPKKYTGILMNFIEQK